MFPGAVPTGLGSYALWLTQDFRPFGFAQGRLWAIMCRPYGAGVGVGRSAFFSSRVGSNFLGYRSGSLDPGSEV
jgi:hypothetical protein